MKEFFTRLNLCLKSYRNDIEKMYYCTTVGGGGGSKDIIFGCGSRNLIQFGLGSFKDLSRFTL